MKPKIMVVEDEIIVATDICEHLEQYGYSAAVIAVSAEQAIQEIEKDPPDLVLMDIKLKGPMDGIEGAAIIRSRFSLPVIFLTSYEDEETIARARKTEPFGYLVKPLKESRELHAAIEIALYKSKIEAEVLKARKLESLGILAGGIAHDFNNLLHVVAGNIDLIRMHIESSSPIHSYLDEADKACYSARGLTKQLITFSSGGAPFRKHGQINELIEKVVNQLFPASQTNYQVVLNLAADLWPIEFDKEQIPHVIKNILINAQESMPQGGCIFIKTHNIDQADADGLDLLPFQGNKIRIEIRDQGIGIKSDDLASVFDPYFSTKIRGGERGMGLGLATVYSIVKKHGGHIQIQSEPKVGTVLWIDFPAVRPNASSTAPSPESSESTSPAALLPPQRILVMDDEPEVRTLLKHILTRLGYEAVLAQHGEEAVDYYRAGLSDGAPFAAVILDLTVRSGMGGRDALNILKNLDPLVKAVVSSGYANDPVMSNYRDYGFCSAIAKPCSLKEFSHIIKKVVSCSHNLTT